MQEFCGSVPFCHKGMAGKEEMKEAHPCAESPPQDTAETGSTAYNSRRNAMRVSNWWK